MDPPPDPGIVSPGISANYVPHKRRLRLSTLLLHATIIFFCVLVLLPFLWILAVSFETLHELYSSVLLPSQLQFDNYRFVFERISPLFPYARNTIILTLTTVVFTTLIAILAGYALVHLKLPGRSVFVSIFVASLFFPTHIVSLIAIWQMERQLHLLSTLPGLILPYVTLGLVFSVLFMRASFTQVPRELMDAARMDGSSAWHTLWAVMLPSVQDGVIVVILINFVAAWGEFLYAATLNDDPSNKTLLLAVLQGVPGEGWFLPQFAVLYLLFVTPAILLFAIFQRSFMQGLKGGTS